MDRGTLVAILASLLAIVWMTASFLAWMFRRGWREQVDATIQLAHAVQARPPESPTGRREPPLLIPDYVDRDVLEDLARQKGIQVDPVEWEHGEEEGAGTEFGAEFGAELGQPGASLGAKFGTREARSLSRYRSRRSEVRYATGALVNELAVALDHDGQLRRDLAHVPEAAEFEAHLMQTLMGAWGEWDLADLEDEDPRKKLDAAVDTLMFECIERVTSAKAKELDEAVPPGGEAQFAIVETEWQVRESTYGLMLVNEWLVNDDGKGGTYEAVIIGDLVRVPIDTEKLVGMGKQKLRPGAVRWWRVFGRIEMFEDDALQLLPIVIAS